MFRSALFNKQKFSLAFNSFKDAFTSKLQSVQLPEKLKGTVIEKWKNYWVNVALDYAEVAKDTVNSAKAAPCKTAAIFSFLGFATYCLKSNPDEKSYRDSVLGYTSEFILVGPDVRNPAAKKYLEEIEGYFNEDVLKCLSFGLFSVIYRENYNDYMGIYKAQCNYLQVPFYNFYTKILDIGFMNKWHVLSRKMVDFDINPEEWHKESE